MWYVYILRCQDNTYYTGVTVDAQRRVREHNYGKKGAKYTRARRPVELVYTRRFRTRARAGKEEARIKSLDRADKTKLVNGLKA